MVVSSVFYLNFTGIMQSAKKSDIIRLKMQHCELIQKDIHKQRSKVLYAVCNVLVLTVAL